MSFLCNSLPKVLCHLTFISKGTPGCAEDCCFTACLILPRWSPVDVAQFPLLAAADSQHLPSSTATLRLPWQEFSFNSPRRSAPLSQESPESLDTPLLASPRYRLPVRLALTPLLGASSFWKTTGAAGCAEGGPSGGNCVQAGFRLLLEPLASPRPILHPISGRPLPSVCHRGSLATCVTCGRSSLLQLKTLLAMSFTLASPLPSYPTNSACVYSNEGFIWLDE